MRSSFIQFLLVSFVLLAPLQSLSSQSFEVERADFSHKNSNDFSPVYFRNGLVFCSTREPENLEKLSPSDQMKDANIWYLPGLKGARQEGEAILWE